MDFTLNEYLAPVTIEKISIFSGCFGATSTVNPPHLSRKLAQLGVLFSKKAPRILISIAMGHTGPEMSVSSNESS